jgi:hypothetical protein
LLAGWSADVKWLLQHGIDRGAATAGIAPSEDDDSPSRKETGVRPPGSIGLVNGAREGIAGRTRLKRDQAFKTDGALSTWERRRQDTAAAGQRDAETPAWPRTTTGRRGSSWVRQSPRGGNGASLHHCVLSVELY